MTTKSWETVLTVVGIPALAIFVALKANSIARRAARAADPVFVIEWNYDKETRRLVVSMKNKGNSEITINEVGLVIVREVITRSGLGRLTVNRLTEPIREIPIAQWWEGYESKQVPVRLAPHFDLPIHVNSKGIGPLPEGIPLLELILRFVAKKPDGGYEFDDISGHGFTLCHFIGLEPDLLGRKHDRAIPRLTRQLPTSTGADNRWHSRP